MPHLPHSTPDWRSHLWRTDSSAALHVGLFYYSEITDLYSQWELKTLFLQEVFARGILTIGTHNMSYSHSDEDIRKLLNVYDEVFAIIENMLEKINLNKLLRTKPLMPLFKIR